MKIEPLGSRAAVKPAKEEEKTSKGLIIPANASKEAPERGEIVAVGEESRLKVGDQVIFKKYAPDEIVVDGEKLLIVEEGDCIARLVCI